MGHSEYALPVEPMGKRAGRQIQEAPETNWLQMPGHFATSAQKNWWEKPSTGKFLTFRWSVPIPSLEGDGVDRGPSESPLSGDPSNNVSIVLVPTLCQVAPSHRSCTSFLHH